MTVQDIVRQFYEAFDQKNDSWQLYVAEDIVFSDASQHLHTEGKAAFIQAFSSFLPALEHIQIQQLIVEGNDACAVVSADYVSPSGRRLRQNDAEILKVVDGKIAALTVYFDITEYRAFMAS